METDTQLVLVTCLLAGRIMMESGSEAYRVEDTMLRIARNSDYEDSDCYVMATGIIMSLNSVSQTQLVQAQNRTINLEKIDATNRLSRIYAEKQLTLSELNAQLQQVDHNTPAFSTPNRMLAAGIASLALMVILGGQYQNTWLAFLIGGIGYWTSGWTLAYFGTKFINDLIAAIVITVLALISRRVGLIGDLDTLITGCVMPLVPGLAITSAIRDLFEGHLVTGIVRGVEALLTSAVIGIGIAIVLKWFG